MIFQISGELYSPWINAKSIFVIAVVSLFVSLRVTSHGGFKHLRSILLGKMIFQCVEQLNLPTKLGFEWISGCLFFLISRFETSPMSGRNWGGRTTRRAPASFGRLGLVPRNFQAFTISLNLETSISPLECLAQCQCSNRTWDMTEILDHQNMSTKRSFTAILIGRQNHFAPSIVAF